MVAVDAQAAVAAPAILALGLLYVPCPGPVLAAITLAGATGEISVGTVVLTVSFALGAAIPLLFFAFAGRRVAGRVKAFRTHQRALPGYTDSLQGRIASNEQVQRQLDLVTAKNEQLSMCTSTATELEDCGPASLARDRRPARHRRRRARRPRRPARVGGAHRLLGVLLHQLPTLGAPRDRVG